MGGEKQRACGFFVDLWICEFVDLCICGFVHLWICAFVDLCICGFGHFHKHYLWNFDFF